MSNGVLASANSRVSIRTSDISRVVIAFIILDSRISTVVYTNQIPVILSFLRTVIAFPSYILLVIAILETGCDLQVIAVPKLLSLFGSTVFEGDLLVEVKQVFRIVLFV